MNKREIRIKALEIAEALISKERRSPSGLSEEVSAEDVNKLQLALSQIEYAIARQRRNAYGKKHWAKVAADQQKRQAECKHEWEWTDDGDEQFEYCIKCNLTRDTISAISV